MDIWPKRTAGETPRIFRQNELVGAPRVFLGLASAELFATLDGADMKVPKLVVFDSYFQKVFLIRLK